jgi:hypothetical protein
LAENLAEKIHTRITVENIEVEGKVQGAKFAIKV